MTELTFLIELLLNHELKKETKDIIAGRIKDVEEMLVRSPIPVKEQSQVLADGYSAKAIPVSPIAPPIVLNAQEQAMREKSRMILKNKNYER